MEEERKKNIRSRDGRRQQGGHGDCLRTWWWCGARFFSWGATGEDGCGGVVSVGFPIMGLSGELGNRQIVPAHDVAMSYFKLVFLDFLGIEGFDAVVV